MVSDSNTLRVLILAPVGRDGPASAELMRRGGLQADLCESVAAAAHELEVGAGAMFVAEEALFGDEVGPLALWVRHQPPWSDLPFVVATSQQSNGAVNQWRQRLIADLGNVALLERPVQAITLAPTDKPLVTSSAHATMAARATTVVYRMETPTVASRYCAAPMPRAAVMPGSITSIAIHPYTNAQRLPNPSRRKTYVPPALGKRVASSA